MRVLVEGKTVELKPSGRVYRGQCPACEGSVNLMVDLRQDKPTARCFLCNARFYDVTVTE